MTVRACTGPCAIDASRRPAALVALICLALLLDGLMPLALAAEATIEASLRLPEPASSQSRQRLEEAVFQPLTPYALDEVPVRLPADQALVSLPDSRDQPAESASAQAADREPD